MLHFYEQRSKKRKDVSNIVKTVNYCHQLCNLIFKAQDKNCQSLMAPEFLPLTNSADPFQDNIFSGSSLSQHQLKFFNYILHNNKKVIISQIRTKALHGAYKSNSQLLPFATRKIYKSFNMPPPARPPTTSPAGAGIPELLGLLFIN